MVILDFLKALSDYVGAITLVVGFSAGFLYKKQKNDNEKEAAKLILQEIRYAEQQIRNHRTIPNSNYYLADKLLPTNSWNKNIHYFIKEIDETEIDLISRFYSHAQYLDNLISEISKIKSSWLLSPDSSVVVTETQKMQGAPTDQQSMEDQQTWGAPPQTQRIQTPPLKLTAVAILEEVSNKVEFIYNTPVVDKLRKISNRKKWYYFFD